MKGAGPAVSADVYGVNFGTWYDFTQSWVNPSLHAAGVHLVRFPGGSESDGYHWENGGSLCKANGGYIANHATFDNFIKDEVEPLHQDVAITLNYGSNRACNAGGEPSEAAAWVAYAKRQNYPVTHWTVGNEVYGSWEYDLHPKKNDASTYAAAVKTGFYPAVKHANVNAKLGIVVNTPDYAAWNDVVLRDSGPFDFVELHYYPEYTYGSSSNDSDAFLLGAAIDHFASYLKGLRAQMNAARVPATTPIYLGEYNSDAGNMGKQSVSITNGLFLGQMIEVAIEAGVPMATWWEAYGSCYQDGNDSSSLYGWQNFGTENLWSDDIPEYACPTAPKISGGTPFPTARVLALLSHGVVPGSIALPTTVSVANVRAYGFSGRSGYTVVAFNNTLSTVAVEVKLSGATSSSFDATETVYGKTQYDLSKNNVWAGPTTTKLGTVGNAVKLDLDPYSVTVLSFAAPAR
ncbi:MAG: hypothetical protein JO199_07155 [Candidatus Eremiobacteraeota bacterium]|nr:hypothetical protein [Candidatus Eremiobacteraeota bacterium]